LRKIEKKLKKTHSPTSSNKTHKVNKFDLKCVYECNFLCIEIICNILHSVIIISKKLFLGLLENWCIWLILCFRYISFIMNPKNSTKKKVMNPKNDLLLVIMIGESIKIRVWILVHYLFIWVDEIAVTNLLDKKNILNFVPISW
jgi:hypothetical protein